MKSQIYERFGAFAYPALSRKKHKSPNEEKRQGGDAVSRLGAWYRIIVLN